MKSSFHSRRAFQALVLTSLCGSVFAQADKPAKAAKPVAAPGATAAAAAWPSKPIRLVVGFPPGSVQDLSARAIAEPLSKALGQPVIVENKSGASGTIAADAVAKSTDLHTFGVMNNSQLTVAKMLNPAVAYDPQRDLAPVALIGTTPMMLVVSASATGATPNERLTWLRNLGEKASYGSPGNGTPGHLGMELLKSRGSFGAVHVPYQGNPQIITAMMGGQLHAALLPPGLAMQQVNAGKLKAIGITADRPSILAPNQLPLRDVGLLGGDVELWTAMAAPASMPYDIREKMTNAMMATLKTEEARTRLFNSGWQVTASNSEGLRLRVKSDVKVLGGIIMMRNIRTEL
jgi:tripartite-type tricarboxylate transporter receptor subunit TctC